MFSISSMIRPLPQSPSHPHDTASNFAEARRIALRRDSTSFCKSEHREQGAASEGLRSATSSAVLHVRPRQRGQFGDFRKTGVPASLLHQKFLGNLSASSCLISLPLKRDNQSAVSNVGELPFPHFLFLKKHKNGVSCCINFRWNFRQR